MKVKFLKNFLPMIHLNHVLVTASILGISGGIYMIRLDHKPIPVAKPIVPPSVSPYTSFIAGAGLIEAKTENIALGTMVNGTVKKVFVKPGDKVPKNLPLFTLDDRLAGADLRTKLAQLETAKTTLEQAKLTLKDAQDKLNLVKRLVDKRAVTEEERLIRRNNVLIAQAAVFNAKASLKEKKTQVEASKATLELYTIRAPFKGQVLQVNVRPGQYATGGGSSTGTPLLLLGGGEHYHVRVDIDEDDAWRFRQDAQAMGFLRGNITYKAPLKFEYIEPYVIPKVSLTGDSTERVDTRVLQIVYSYDPKTLPSYIGQQMDVYIEASKLSSDVKYGGPLEVSK